MEQSSSIGCLLLVEMLLTEGLLSVFHDFLCQTNRLLP